MIYMSNSCQPQRTYDEEFISYRTGFNRFPAAHPGLYQNPQHYSAFGLSHGAYSATDPISLSVFDQRRFYPDRSFISDTPTEYNDPNIQVTLENSELWRKFHAIGTEMIITKTGRRMFPTLKINITGLDEHRKYALGVDLISVDDDRYKYHNNQWIVTGKAEPQFGNCVYIHPDSPSTGSQWMKQVVSFQKMKLTNNPAAQGQIVLNSMHKYQPRIRIIQVHDVFGTRYGRVSYFTFEETVFIAVTAYQNEEITQLKIDNNPFAKGFRENAHGRREARNSKRERRDSSTKSDTTKRAKRELLDSEDTEKMSEKREQAPSEVLDSVQSSFNKDQDESDIQPHYRNGNVPSSTNSQADVETPPNHPYTHVYAHDPRFVTSLNYGLNQFNMNNGFFPSYS